MLSTEFGDHSASSRTKDGGSPSWIQTTPIDKKSSARILRGSFCRSRARSRRSVAGPALIIFARERDQGISGFDESCRWRAACAMTGKYPKAGFRGLWRRHSSHLVPARPAISLTIVRYFRPWPPITAQNFQVCGSRPADSPLLHDNTPSEIRLPSEPSADATMLCQVACSSRRAWQRCLSDADTDVGFRNRIFQRFQYFDEIQDSKYMNITRKYAKMLQKFLHIITLKFMMEANGG